jgi:hypothetical protein
VDRKQAGERERERERRKAPQTKILFSLSLFLHTHTHSVKRLMMATTAAVVESTSSPPLEGEDSEDVPTDITSVDLDFDSFTGSHRPVPLRAAHTFF